MLKQMKQIEFFINVLVVIALYSFLSQLVQTE